MNGAGGPGRRRAGRLASAVTGAALVAAACGGSSTTSAGLPSLQTITAQALAYAKCMRSHGIANFPDPYENSHQVGFSTTGLDQNSARFKAASTACRPLLPGGGP